MMATTFEIVERLRERPFQLTDVSDFRSREIGQLPAAKILENPRITLYSLDFENSRAVFVETPADVDLSQVPFYFVTQYEEAERVLTISFDTMLLLAQSVIVDDNRLIFIHSVGRSGSTLASQIFAQIPGVINISEPDALTLLVVARNSKAYNEDDLLARFPALEPERAGADGDQRVPAVAPQPGRWRHCRTTPPKKPRSWVVATADV